MTLDIDYLIKDGEPQYEVRASVYRLDGTYVTFRCRNSSGGSENLPATGLRPPLHAGPGHPDRPRPRAEP